MGFRFYFDKNSSQPMNFFMNYIVFGIINVSAYFINFIFLMPELLKKRRKYGLYVVSFFVLLVAVAILKTAIAILSSNQSMTYQHLDKTLVLSIYKYFFFAIFISGFILVSSCVIKFVTDWFVAERTQIKLESEKKDMELQFLKSQFNPHFLFNSLNNIYSLAYQKSDKTADAILKLAELMRYMIYESNDDWVALIKEVSYVKSYVDLQKLRFKDSAAVEININGIIDRQKIIPLILISFVENAFKHGVANDINDPIKININANTQILHFSVTNKKNNMNKDTARGVGLNNVERRLQLLYHQRYELNVVNSATHYTTELMLDL